MEKHDTRNLFYLNKFYITKYILPNYRKATILGKVSPKCTYLSQDADLRPWGIATCCFGRWMCSVICAPANVCQPVCYRPCSISCRFSGRNVSAVDSKIRKKIILWPHFLSPQYGRPELHIAMPARRKGLLQPMFLAELPDLAQTRSNHTLQHCFTECTTPAESGQAFSFLFFLTRDTAFQNHGAMPRDMLIKLISLAQ